MNLKYIFIYFLFVMSFPLMAETVIDVQCAQKSTKNIDLTLCINKSHDFYSLRSGGLTVEWEPQSDEKALLQQIHPKRATSSFFLYHWDFAKQKTNPNVVNIEFFPSFDLLSINSENELIENYFPKMPRGLFPVFRINF